MAALAVRAFGRTAFDRSRRHNGRGIHNGCRHTGIGGPPLGGAPYSAGFRHDDHRLGKRPGQGISLGGIPFEFVLRRVHRAQQDSPRTHESAIAGGAPVVAIGANRLSHRPPEQGEFRCSWHGATSGRSRGLPAKLRACVDRSGRLQKRKRRACPCASFIESEFVADRGEVAFNHFTRQKLSLPVVPVERRRDIVDVR
ncbi:hypothetical protein V1281_004491 [Nitrobacteraceae bacterium AZCC 2161]